MTEKEKMLSGKLYNSRDPQLIERYHLARRLMAKINGYPIMEQAEKTELLTQLLGYIGENVWIETPFFCDYGEHIHIGSGTFIHFNAMFLDNHIISIGKNGLIGPGVQLLTAGHPISSKERIELKPGDGGTKVGYKTFSQPITIGENVWIGGNTVVLPGVRIGNNVTIGAGSVVTKDLPDCVLAFGNPCRIIRSIE
jgi:maltose O-acetyltransferase